jgi:hypothetical protein
MLNGRGVIGMKKIPFKLFLKHYIGFVMILLLITFLLGSSNAISVLFLITVALPITAIMLFTGWDEKLKKYLP